MSYVYTVSDLGGDGVSYRYPPRIDLSRCIQHLQEYKLHR